MGILTQALRATATTALACTMLVPGAADALTYKTKEGSVTNGQSTLLKRGCPGGRHPVGGGIRAPRFLEQRVTSLGPSDGSDPDPVADDGWAARVDGFAVSNVPLELVVICSRSAPTEIQTIQTSILSGSTLGWDNADCLPGSHAIGGGTYATVGWAEMRLLASYPLDSMADPDTRPDDSWFSDAYNGSGGTRQVTMTGICGKGSYKYVQKEGAVPPGGEGRASVRCPAGSQLGAGGFDVTGNPLVALSAAFPRPGAQHHPDRWVVRVEDFGGNSRTLTAQAVCKT